MIIMLSYQHSYHAGNFADVVKHMTLCRILHYLTHKDSPIYYLETHAGRGHYSLEHSHALKTKEADAGIQQIWQQPALPDALSTYLALVKQYNPSARLTEYPGSPALAISLLRAQDRLICCELHPTEFSHLTRLPKHNKRVFFSHSNGLDGLKSTLPPPEKRGLVFIDPSYELKNDYQNIPQLVHHAYLRFRTGVYCIWYPILAAHPHLRLIKRLQQIPTTKWLRIEFSLTQTPLAGMYGCGLWIINPPYRLADDLADGLAALKQHLSSNTITYTLEQP